MTTKILFNPDLMSDLDATQVGRIGEYLVAAILSGYGYEFITQPEVATFASNVADNAGSIRVDVKAKKAATGAQLYSIRKVKPLRLEITEAGGCDVFALMYEDMSVAFEAMPMITMARNPSTLIA